MEQSAAFLEATSNIEELVVLPDPRRLPISVLMSTYAKERAENLQLSLKSIVQQTRQPTEIVLVIDGPIGHEQHAVINNISSAKDSPRFVVVNLTENKGLASAMNAGLAACSCDYIARMDSDDVCRLDRFEKQWEYLRDHPEIDVVASWQGDFENNPEEIVRIKRTPKTHEEIHDSLWCRNVLSHPTLIFRRNALVREQGYNPEFKQMEDYELHMRLISRGYRYATIPEVLVFVRADRRQRNRRGSFRSLVEELSIRSCGYRYGIVSPLKAITALCIRIIFWGMPCNVKNLLYTIVRT